MVHEILLLKDGPWGEEVENNCPKTKWIV